MAEPQAQPPWPKSQPAFGRRLNSADANRQRAGFDEDVTFMKAVVLISASLAFSAIAQGQAPSATLAGTRASSPSAAEAVTSPSPGASPEISPASPASPAASAA